jgi:hypothetical protein
MALIKCHECGGLVSDQAGTCPICGAPVIDTIKRRQKAALIELGLRVVLAIIICVTFLIVVRHVMKEPPKALQQQSAPGH